MKDDEFLDVLQARGDITETCRYLERAVHKLQLMSVRKKITVVEMQAQIGQIKQWLGDLEKQVSKKPSKPTARTK